MPSAASRGPLRAFLVATFSTRKAKIAVPGPGSAVKAPSLLPHSSTFEDPGDPIQATQNNL